jgi:hypothetical protein
VLKEAELYAYRPAVVAEISDMNKEKRLAFCRQTNKWISIVFSDKSWICAEAFHLHYVRRFHRETLSEEYSLKKTRFKGGKKLFVWAAISFDGPEYLYFIEGKENTDAYKKILNTALPNIKKLWQGEYIFQQDNATPHSALLRRGYFDNKPFEVLK